MSWSYDYNKKNVNPNVVRLFIKHEKIDIPARSHLCDVCGKPIVIFDSLTKDESGNIICVGGHPCVIEYWKTEPYERRGYKFRKETVDFLTTFRHIECRR